jgi:hypothetical protein
MRTEVEAVVRGTPPPAEVAFAVAREDERGFVAGVLQELGFRPYGEHQWRRPEEWVAWVMVGVESAFLGRREAPPTLADLDYRAGAVFEIGGRVRVPVVRLS